MTSPPDQIERYLAFAGDPLPPIWLNDAGIRTDRAGATMVTLRRQVSGQRFGQISIRLDLADLPALPYDFPELEARFA